MDHPSEKRRCFLPVAPALRRLVAAALLLPAAGSAAADGPTASGTVGVSLVIPPHLGVQERGGELCLTARRATPVTLLTAAGRRTAVATRHGPCIDPAVLAAGSAARAAGAPLLLVVRPE